MDLSTCACFDVPMCVPCLHRKCNRICEDTQETEHAWETSLIKFLVYGRLVCWEHRPNMNMGHHLSQWPHCLCKQCTRICVDPKTEHQKPPISISHATPMSVYKMYYNLCRHKDLCKTKHQKPPIIAGTTLYRFLHGHRWTCPSTLLGVHVGVHLQIAQDGPLNMRMFWCAHVCPMSA